MSDSNSVTKITSEQALRDLVKTQPIVVVDFYADWCGPCKVAAPKFAELASKYTKAKFVSLNVDELQETASNMGIKSIPTFIIYKDGMPAHRVVGGNIPEVDRIIASM